jgi:hypothetical protein
MATQHQVNAAPAPEHKDAADAKAAATAGTVWVSKVYFGAAVTQVKQTTSASGNLYFLNYSGGPAATSLDFIVTFKAGSPLTHQHQRFTFSGGGYGGGVTTPFGVPDWGGNPILGPAVLTVLANGSPVGSYNFTVIA